MDIINDHTNGDFNKMTIEKNIYDKIIDVINESHKNKEKQPKIRERQSFEIVGGKTLLVDIPKKSKIFYHSSSYIIECDEKKKICKTEGTLVTYLNTGDKVKKELENFKCDILAIHDHDSLSTKSTHIHLQCKDRPYDITLQISKFLAEH